MKLLVLPVIVHRLADFAIHMDVAQSIEDLDDLAVPLAPALQECEPDPPAEHRRVGDRGDIALIVFERRLVAAIEEVRARPKLIGRVDWPNAYHLLAILGDEAFATCHP